MPISRKHHRLRTYKGLKVGKWPLVEKIKDFRLVMPKSVEYYSLHNTSKKEKY